jgi:hypothetical protein
MSSNRCGNVIRASVKGLLLGGIVAQVRRMLESERLGEEDMLARIGPEASAVLDQKVQPIRWYPIEAYRDLVDLVWEIEGDRNPEFMREKGRAWAEKAYRKGYQQLEYADSAPQLQTGAEAVRQGRLIASLIGAFWSFVEPEVDLDPDPDRADTLRMTFRNAGSFPEANRYTVEGFLNHMVERGGGRTHSSSERPEVDVVVFRLPLELTPSEGA